MALLDTQKGEQLILITEYQDTAHTELPAHAKENGISELIVPKTLIPVNKVLVLGTVKTAYIWC